MRMYRDDVKVTMTGLDKVGELAEQIHKKSVELRELVYEFERLQLELGIDIVRTPKDDSAGTEKAES